ncbi:MAG: hypothetical protein OXG15_02395 [Gammaproteobacteria bacterium]|nr:hypothetical protein [Gammaproteobacteria bacterium]
MTLKILGDRIQLTEDRFGTMRVQGGASNRSEIVTMSGREVDKFENVRAKAKNIRNLNQMKITIPIVSEQYSWSGWCNIVQAQASIEEKTVSDSEASGTSCLNWSLTLERIDGQQEIRIIPSIRDYNGTFTPTQRIGLPNYIVGGFFPRGTATFGIANYEYDVAEFKNMKNVTSGFRYTLSPDDGHVGQVRLDIGGNPVVGLQSINRFDGDWAVDNGLFRLRNRSGSLLEMSSGLRGYEGNSVLLNFGNAMTDPSEISISYNSYFLTVIRLYFGTSQLDSIADIVVRRGDPIATLNVKGHKTAPAFSASGWTKSAQWYRRTGGLQPPMSAVLGIAKDNVNDGLLHLSLGTNQASERHANWLATPDQWVRMVEV